MYEEFFKLSSYDPSADSSVQERNTASVVGSTADRPSDVGLFFCETKTGDLQVAVSVASTDFLYPFDATTSGAR